ncbi:MAG: hypothetical protein LBG76_02885 [Treponema sp.]|jgi:hypothetical protein|nr:hypothetical protein [Treponema sp.]
MVNIPDGPRNRIGLLLFIGMMAFFAFFAEIIIVSRLDHDCTGEPCPICLEIGNARALLEGIGRACAAVLAAGFAVSFRKALVRLFPPLCFFPLTPVALKVKLSF